MRRTLMLLCSMMLLHCGGTTTGSSDADTPDSSMTSDVVVSDGSAADVSASDGATMRMEAGMLDPRCPMPMPAAGGVCMEEGLRCDYPSTRSICGIERFECMTGRWRGREPCL